MLYLRMIDYRVIQCLHIFIRVISLLIIRCSIHAGDKVIAELIKECVNSLCDYQRMVLIHSQVTDEMKQSVEDTDNMHTSKLDGVPMGIDANDTCGNLESNTTAFHQILVCMSLSRVKR